MRVAVDRLVDNRTAYERRFNCPFPGQLIPFGAAVRHLPFRDRRNESSVVPSVGDKTSPAVFIGYHMHPGGRFSGDYLMVDYASLVNSSTPAEVPIRRVSEVIFDESRLTFP